MMSLPKQKQRLSLVAQFDDLVRNNRVLQQGTETEFERFVRLQEQWRQRMVKSEKESERLRWENNELKRNVELLEERVKVVQVHLEKELEKHKVTRKAKQNLERQVDVIREVLNANNGRKILDEKERERLEECMSQLSAMESPYIRNNNMTMVDVSGDFLDDDIDYDTTGENVLDTSYLRSGRTWKRSNSNLRGGDFPEKKKSKKTTRASRNQTRHRRSRSSSAVLNGNNVLSAARTPQPEARFHSTSPTRKTMKKYNSDSTPKHGPHDVASPGEKSLAPNSLSRHNSGNLDRPHTFFPKTSLKPGESCSACGKRIGFGKPALKCKDCRAMAHDQCKNDVPLPCAPVSQTPLKNTRNELASFVPMDPPFIPAIIVHCVKEVELRGLNEQGLYRISGSDKQVKELQEKFGKRRAIPMLSTVEDINVICSFMKAFLRELSEPLVTYGLWLSFSQAAQLSDKDEALSQLYQAVSQLPRPNRDTLAYLVQHLHTVIDSPQVRMGINNLATVFGPTVVGCSSPHPQPMQELKETQSANKVVQLMLEAPLDYWKNFLDVPANISAYPPNSSVTKTPDYRGFESLLGPLDGESAAEEMPWLTAPRNPRMLNNKGNFFQSPVL